MTIDLSRPLHLSSGVHVRRFDADLIVLDLEHGGYYALNEVGAALVERSVDGRPLDSIIEELLTEYEVAREVLVADVEALISELVSKRLVRLGGDP